MSTMHSKREVVKMNRVGARDKARAGGTSFRTWLLRTARPGSVLRPRGEFIMWARKHIEAETFPTHNTWMAVRAFLDKQGVDWRMGRAAGLLWRGYLAWGAKYDR